MTAIDTPTSLTTAQLAALRAAGVTAVSRYIAPQLWKVCTVAECASYGPAGMQWTLNWESGAQDLKTLPVTSKTSANTTDYAHQAVAMAQARAYPAGCAIYVSADWNVASGDWPVVAANLRVIRPIFAAAGYRLGLYAPWDALTWAKRDGLVDYYWQAGMSTSWSGGRNASAWPGAHLRQRRSTTLAGADCDINDILISAFGQAGATPKPQEDPMAVMVNIIFPDGSNKAGPTDGLGNWRWIGDMGSARELEAAFGATRQITAAMATSAYGIVFDAHGNYVPPTAPVAVAVDEAKLAADIVAGLVAAGVGGLTAQQVTDAVVAGLGKLQLTVES